MEKETIWSADDVIEMCQKYMNKERISICDSLINGIIEKFNHEREMIER